MSLCYSVANNIAMFTFHLGSFLNRFGTGLMGEYHAPIFVRWIHEHAQIILPQHDEVSVIDFCPHSYPRYYSNHNSSLFISSKHVGPAKKEPPKGHCFLDIIKPNINSSTHIQGFRPPWNERGNEGSQSWLKKIIGTTENLLLHSSKRTHFIKTEDIQDCNRTNHWGHSSLLISQHDK